MSLSLIVIVLCVACLILMYIGSREWQPYTHPHDHREPDRYQHRPIVVPEWIKQTLDNAPEKVDEFQLFETGDGERGLRDFKAKQEDVS